MVLLATLLLVAYTQAQVPDPNCKDKLPNCNLYGADSCKGTYQTWAEQNCQATCKFCVAPPKPCEDKDTTCDLYDRSTCDNPNFQHWADTNCRYHCRRCTAEQLAAKDAKTTTVPPSLCKDKKSDCRQYGKTACTGTYEHWAKINCMEYCGFCQGPPTPPRACADTIPTCISYPKSTCTNAKYTIWVQDNCAAYCGLCQGSGPTAGPGTPHVPVHTQGPGPITPGGHGVPTPPMPGK